MKGTALTYNGDYQVQRTTTPADVETEFESSFRKFLATSNNILRGISCSGVYAESVLWYYSSTVFIVSYY